MNSFLARLLRASCWGATLVVAAGCTTPIGGGVVDENGDPLESQPELACEGPIYDDGFGYHGQCCYEVHCAAAVDGVCASPDTATLTDLPPGSGTCECGTRSGPYLNNDAAAVDDCCYHVGSIGCDGRPLLIDGSPRLADVIPGASASAWSVMPSAGSRGLSAAELPEGAALRSMLARRWAERARFEHASIASFSRFSLALLACAAPPALVAGSQEAALDEVRHARVALELSAAYAGQPLSFGPLDISGAMSGPMTLEAVTLSTVIEGCVGETLAAMEVAASAAAAVSPTVKAALSAIAEDETRHAELAWAFVRWAIGVAGPGLRAQVATAFEQAFAQVRAGVSSDDPAGAPEHGFLPDSDASQLRRTAVAQVLRPAVTALLSSATSAASAASAASAGSSDSHRARAAQPGARPVEPRA